MKKSFTSNYTRLKLNISRITIIILWLIWSVGISLAQSTTQKQALKNTITQQIDSIFTSFYQPEEPGVAVIVLSDGKIVFRKAYGMANIELGVQTQPDMVFGLASVTKPFTAIAIMMLEEKGKLSLKDEIVKYLPDYSNGKGVTIEHLLTHTSGIKNLASILEHREDWRHKELSPDELIDMFKDEPLGFIPGEKFEYSHFNYVLLGRIIEIVSGQSWENFIKTRILEPIGMTNTYYGGHNRIIPKSVTAYHKESDDWRHSPYVSWTSGYAGGGLFSSVDDLVRWYTILHEGKLLNKKNLNRMFSPFTLNNGKTSNYGYGWSIKYFRGRRSVSHGGTIFGYRSFIAMLPEKDIFVVVLTSGTGRYDVNNSPPRQAISIIRLLLNN